MEESICDREAEDRNIGHLSTLSDLSHLFQRDGIKVRGNIEVIKIGEDNNL